jgi:hypothetical protein
MFLEEQMAGNLVHNKGVTSCMGGGSNQPHARLESNNEGRGCRDEKPGDQEFNRGNPSLNSVSSQNGLSLMVSVWTVAVPSPRFNHTHLYCFATVTKGPHLGRSEFKGSSQTMSLSG